MAEKKSSGKGKALQDSYGLPTFNDGSTFSGRWTGPGSHKFISDADAGKMFSSAFTATSPALSPPDVASEGDLGSSESLTQILQDIAGDVASIEGFVGRLLTIAIDDSPALAVREPMDSALVVSDGESADTDFIDSESSSSELLDIFQQIAHNVNLMMYDVNQLVTISQAETRGDALNSANVPQDDLKSLPKPDEDGVFRGGRDDGGADAGGGVGGLTGMAGFIGSLGIGLRAWGNPATALGVPVFLLFLAGLTAVAWFGSKMFAKSAPHIAEGMETLSNAEVDTEKVVQIAKALAAMGGALAAEGLGAALGSIGSLVSGVVDGLGGLLGIDKRDPMAELKAFAKHPFTEDEIKQIELNARGLKAFGGAMAAEGIGSAVSSIAGLVSGVADGLRSLIPVEEKDPMEQMWAFKEWKFTPDDVKQIKLNAAALLGFSTVMATVKTINVWTDIAELASGIVNFASSFFPEGKDPMVEMRKFAGHKFTIDEVAQITLNAKALLAFSSTMGVAKTMGAVGDITSMFGGIANAVSSFFGFDEKDPMVDMLAFSKHEFTQKQVDQIKLNAGALVSFSNAMALYSAGTAGAAALDLIGSMATGITNFFGGTTGIDYAEIKTFAESGIDQYETQITTNAKVLGAFSLAMSEHASDQAGVEWKNIGTNILGAVGSIFGGKPEDNIPFDEITAFAKVPWGEETTKKIETNALTLHAYTEAIAKMSSLKQEDGFWSSIGKSLSGAFSALLGQDKMPIEEITAFTEKTLDLAVVENNITAIEKFMDFGTSLNDWVPGDTGKFGDFAAGMVGVAHGIQYALHGGDKKFVIPGWADNIRINAGEGLASVDLMDMQNSAKGIAVLRHSLIAQEPLQALQDASAAMDASTGSVTVVNANNNSTNNSSAATNNYQEMNVDHIEQSGSWYSRVDWTPWN